VFRHSKQSGHSGRQGQAKTLRTFHATFVGVYADPGLDSTRIAAHTEFLRDQRSVESTVQSITMFANWEPHLAPMLQLLHWLSHWHTFLRAMF